MDYRSLQTARVTFAEAQREFANAEQEYKETSVSLQAKREEV
jgi:hypothetical protein